MDPSRLIELTTAFGAVAAGVAFVLLLPLYLSQRRDISRLRGLMEREPSHPEADLRASELRLDRAERELQGLLAERGEAEAETEVKPPESLPSGLSPAAARVASERPALTRITLERAALEPHPRWRRFAGRLTQPWVLGALGAVAVLVAVAVIYGAVTLPLGGESAPGEFDRSEVSVSILNGTSVGGLAGTVESEVDERGYRIEAVGGTESGYERTVVMYRPGARRAARRVANDLGAGEGSVERLDPAVAPQSAGAMVVVVVGEDRA